MTTNEPEAELTGHHVTVLPSEATDRLTDRPAPREGATPQTADRRRGAPPGDSVHNPAWLPALSLSLTAQHRQLQN